MRQKFIKYSGITLIYIVIAIVIFIISLIVCSREKNKKIDEQVQEEIHVDKEEGLTGLIDNEQYYYDVQKEYDKNFNEYEELVRKFANEKFTEVQKVKIKELQDKITEAANNQDEDAQKKASNEYVNTYNEFMKQQFTEEQLKILKQKKDKMDELEPITVEYFDLLEKAREEKSKEGLETLEDGRIKSNRQGILSDKEYDGIKFSEIQLIYDPIIDQTSIFMKATNMTNDTKGNKMVTLHFTGSTEGTYMMMLNEIPEGEFDIINFSMYADLRDTETFEIIDFNEDDYLKR